MAAKKQCAAINAEKNRCGLRTTGHSKYCGVHKKKKTIPGVGGKRKGAGRKADSYAGWLSDFGPPPDDSLERCEWLEKVLARACYETMIGNGSVTLNTQLRQLAATCLKMVPMSRLAAAERKLQGMSEQKPRSSSGEKNQSVKESAATSRSGPVRR